MTMTEHSSHPLEKYDNIPDSSQQTHLGESNKRSQPNARETQIKVNGTTVEKLHLAEVEDDSCGSEISTVHNGSEISTVPDKYGFIGGQQYRQYDGKNYLNPAKILSREKKWLDMTNKWEEIMKKNYKKVRERCRKGIPVSVRPTAWFYLCGGKFLKDEHAGYYEELILQPGDPKVMDDIRKDIERQFPMHEMFCDSNGPGVQELSNILKAYSIVNPIVGYCQAQAPIAAFLLLHMPAEHAFWCLYSICDKYLKGYYSPGMEMIQIDGEILFNLLKKVYPNIYRHLKKQSLEPIVYMTEWFLCAFTRSLPHETLLRVWDIFMCEGVKILFKVALIVIKYSLPCRSYRQLKKDFPTMYETLQALRNASHQVKELRDEDFVVHQILKINLTVEDFQYEHQKQTLKRNRIKKAEAARANTENDNSTR